MTPRTRITVQPTAQALPLAALKLHLRVTHDVEDALILAYLDAAVSDGESLTNRQWLQATRVLTLDVFPSHDSPIELPRPPLQSVTSVQYVDLDGVTQTMDPDDYQLDNSSGTMPAKLYPAYGMTWPDTRNQFGAVTVTYVCGWPQAPESADPDAVDIADLPSGIVAWLKIRTADRYMQRESVAMENRSQSFVALPRSYVDGLLDPWIVPVGV